MSLGVFIAVPGPQNSEWGAYLHLMAVFQYNIYHLPSDISCFISACSPIPHPPRTDLTTVSRGTVIRPDTDAYSPEHLRCWAMRMARDLTHACMVYARF